MAYFCNNCYISMLKLLASVFSLRWPGMAWNGLEWPGRVFKKIDVNGRGLFSLCE